MLFGTVMGAAGAVLATGLLGLLLGRRRLLEQAGVALHVVAAD